MEARIIQNTDGTVDITVGHHGGYSPDAMDEIITYAFQLYSWVREEQREQAEAED